MYSNEFPTRLLEQVTKTGDCALLAIKMTHHLFVGCAPPHEKKKKKKDVESRVSRVIVVI